MDKLRIAELLHPFLTWPLSDRQLADISTYIDVLLKWNQRMNLTAVREPEDIVTRHFGESLFAAQHLFPAGTHVVTAAPERPAHVGAGALTRPAEQSPAPQTRAAGATDHKEPTDAISVIDVGSGAGFPGLPVKIWAPEIRLTLIESNQKKATFLKEVGRTLGFEGVEVFCGRADSFPSASANVVTLRAVERFETVLPIAAGLVEPGGGLALLIGNAQANKAHVTDVEWQDPTPIPLSKNRVLMRGMK